MTRRSVGEYERAPGNSIGTFEAGEEGGLIFKKIYIYIYSAGILVPKKKKNIHAPKIVHAWYSPSLKVKWSTP